MLQNLDTPLILELVVESTRIIMFVLMVPLLEKREYAVIKQKTFWDELLASASLKLKNNFPHIFIAQLVIYILILAVLGNVLIRILVNSSFLYIIELFSLDGYAESAVYHAYLYFLKNISIIPLTMVFVLKVIGVGQSIRR
ncbi:hypothetical protein [Radiobacillus deserti]|nr:hypothetical protein [Radiobacillus deserti]